MKRTLIMLGAVLLIALSTSFAYAEDAFETYHLDDLSYQVPSSWVFEVDGDDNVHRQSDPSGGSREGKLTVRFYPDRNLSDKSDDEILPELAGYAGFVFQMNGLQDFEAIPLRVNNFLSVSYKIVVKQSSHSFSCYACFLYHNDGIISIIYYHQTLEEQEVFSTFESILATLEVDP